MFIENDSEKKYAIVCGSIRFEFEFYTTISLLCEFRKKSLITDIVLSTWNGEVDKVAGLRQKLERMGVYIVESEDICGSTVSISQESNYGYYRQIEQIRAALKVLPANCYVVKCRTDYCHYDLIKLEDKLSKLDLSLQEYGDINIGLSEKIIVTRASFPMPFMMHDISFVGKKQDIEKLTTSCPFIKNGERLLPDIYIFASYFMMQFTILEDYFEVIRYEKFWKCLSENTNPIEELPQFLLEVYALYLVIVYSCFSISRDTEYGTNSEVIVEDLFDSRRGGANKQGIISIYSNQLIKNIIDGKIKKTKLSTKLYEEICKMRSAEYAKRLCLTKDKYEELLNWGKQQFGDDIDWIVPYYKFENLRKDDVDYQECAEILFGVEGFTKKAGDIICEIGHKKESYYDAIIENLNLLKNEDEELYKKALFASGRYFNEEVLLDSAKYLADGDLNDIEEQAASYIFIRYSDKNDTQFRHLFSFPMSQKRVEALYYYTLYEKKKNKRTVTDRLCKAIVEHYEVNDTLANEYQVCNLLDKIGETKEWCDDETYLLLCKCFCSL